MATALCAMAIGLNAVAGAAGPPAGLDARAWELVSPVDKNAGEVGAPGTEAGGVQQAAATGGALAFGSASSFGAAVGSLPVNQYLARRTAAGWSTGNITPPALSGTYEDGAYRRFSEHLSTAILADGWACRDGSPPCPAEGPALGAGGPPGYRNLYLREGDAYTTLVTVANSPLLTVSAEDFQLSLAGASPDLGHLVISTCAALTPGSIEVAAVEGCDPAAQNLYEWEGGQLQVLNVLPDEASSAPGAALAGGPGAISADGSRVYWTHAGGLYLRDGGDTELVADEAAFQAATRDGAFAFFIKAGHLYRYEATSGKIVDLSPAGAVQALIASSDDGAYLYYVGANGLYRVAHGASTKLFPASPSQLPPAFGAARASADGSRLFFDSAGQLSFQDTNGSPDVYEWEAQGVGTCVRSGGCLGLISGGRSGGAALVDASASGDDVFFATATPLLPRDPDSALDVYDARAGGGFREPAPPTCIGDDCPDPAVAPLFELPPTATLPPRANPPIAFTKPRPKHKKKKHRHRGRRKHHHQARSS